MAVTGGEGGLGRAVAAVFRGAGWEVDSPGRQDLDVTDHLAVDRYFAGREIELLVCAAGVTGEALLARLGGDAWDQVWAVNFRGALNAARAAIPGMGTRGGGHVVFVSSFVALHPPAGLTAYASAKAALLGLTRELAERHGRQSVRVNAVLPGFMATPMTREVGEARRSEVLRQHALGTFNTPEVVAEFIAFAHERLPHTSGQVFQLDSRTPP